MPALLRLDTHNEQDLLKHSIAVTVLLSVLGTAAGLAAGSLAILFDSLYEMADALMTVLALTVVRLVAASRAGNLPPRLARRFTMGFWHLEPLVVALNGCMLLGAVGYALLLSVDSLLSGGRHVQPGMVLAYASAFMLVQLAMGLLVWRRNRRIGSSLLAIDAQSWFMAAATSLALLPAFGMALAARGTRWEWLLPYIDPAALALICLCILPIPLRALRGALTGILLVTPQPLREQIDEQARAVVRRHGLLAHASHVAQVGKETQVELHFLVPATLSHTVAHWDTIRAEIAEALGPDPDRWLCVNFTARQGWLPA